jgi:hypothetical protein
LLGSWRLLLCIWPFLGSRALNSGL